MDSTRKTALVAGTFYLITFVGAIPALILLNPIVGHPEYIVGAGADTSVYWGILLDVVNVLAGVGTAVTLFPVVKRQNEAAALGFVTSRVLEAAILMIGVISLLAVVTLRQDLAGATGTDVAALRQTGQALGAVRDWTSLLGLGLMPAVNALLLGSLLYRSRLVPRIIPAIGLIGAPLLLASAIATLLGYNEQGSAWSSIATLPVAAFELSVGVYLAVKGFRPSPVTTAPAEPDGSLTAA
jgi:uncharacterized protein DUF4386